MKKSFLVFASLIALLFSCKNDSNPSEEPSNDMDAVSIFIRAALDGDYAKAKTMLVPDSLNLQLIDAYQRSYEVQLSKEEKNKYRAATIRIHDRTKLNDSTSIVVYSNSYRNLKDSLKVIRMGDKWLIDFADDYRNKIDTLK